ncbi:sugar transferase [Lentzea nigeriaca]|uniref:sugar transferase n=1 Tax=Lentzea nigeriaca TaxID=1128665 RepID=UPI00195934CE|nr:sugar transferase [Lentzea nigeriaca]MBM7857177.1 lipopolysaccharide/colanic/teichoic acid biosynthesis glycosyltransferase [Lentzea nigeriaca]
MSSRAAVTHPRAQGVREPVHASGRFSAASAVIPAGDAVAVLVAAGVTGWKWTAIAYAAAVLTVLRSSGTQRVRICPRFGEELPWIALAVAVPAVLMRSWVDIALVVATSAAAVVVRPLCYAVLRAARRRHRLAEPTVIIGTGTLAVELADILCAHAEFGLRPVGFVDHLPPGPAAGLPLLGAPGELAAVVARYQVRHVIVCFPAVSDAQLVPILRARRAARVHLVPRLYELGTTIPARHRDEIHGIPLVTLRAPSGNPVTKRAFDLVVGTALLVLLAPLLAVLSAALLVRHGRPVLFRQMRLSRDGECVPILKLRTLDDPAPDTSWAVPESGSRLRWWLRATHFDELPQLWCVLRGDLSLVGPRPERPYFAARFAATIPRYADRHRLPGGLTGWAQVHGLHGDTSIRQRVRFDNVYVEHWSLWTDLVVLVRTLTTPLAVLRRSEGERQ